MNPSRFGVVALLGLAAPAVHGQAGTATYSVAFGSPTGPSSVLLTIGQSIDVFVNVAWTTAGNPPPIGLADGRFSLVRTSLDWSGTWTINTNTSSSTYALPNPWGAQGVGGAGVHTGTVSGSNVNGVIWGYGFLFSNVHPFPQNPANVWRGTFTKTSGFSVIPVEFAFTQLGPTGVWVVNPTGPFANVVLYNSVPAPGSLVALAIVLMPRRRR